MLAIDEDLYQNQLQIKKDRLKHYYLQPYSNLELKAFASPMQHFRMRAEFRIWHKNEEAHYAMFFNPSNKQPTFLEDFPYASAKINELMPALKQQWQQYPLLKNKLFQVDFLTTLSDQSLITLYYHKTLDEEWLSLAKIIAQQLNTKIIGRARQQQLMTHDNVVTETLTVLGQQYQYIQPENSFTQPNAMVNQKMITWVSLHLAEFKHDLLELYCGNGNFTIPLSNTVNHVFATEISKLSIAALQQNIILNQVNNIKFARLSAVELIQAMEKVRPFKRLANINLEAYQFDTVFVDPPRMGLDPHTCQWLSQFKNIIYISCNPDSLVENLKTLTQTHRISAQALFDQFPYTHHIESGVVLQKK